MWGFLTFERFVAQDVLMLFYYAGAVGMPFVLWYLRRRLVSALPWCRSADTELRKLYGRLDTGRKIATLLFFISLFLSMELMWRMMFETMIGYFQMHDALMRLAAGITGEVP